MDALSHSKEYRLYSHVSQETTVRLPVLVDMRAYRRILVIVINETRSCLLDARDKDFIV